MFLYPNAYLDSVLDIDEKFLKKNNIKGLLLDVDNTLIDFDKKLSKEIIAWSDRTKALGIKMCILSNTNKYEKVKTVSEKLDIEFIYFAKKPSKKGFLKGRDKLGLDVKNIAIVGDQIFTDIIGGNRVGMFGILVKPIDDRDIFITKIKRPIEQWIINKYNKGRK